MKKMFQIILQLTPTLSESHQLHATTPILTYVEIVLLKIFVGKSYSQYIIKAFSSANY